MIIVALDTSSTEEVENLLNVLDDKVSCYKIGLEQYLATQGKIVDSLIERKKNVFLDLKFHDIPSTTAAASREATKKGVWMFNIHVTANETMKDAVDARNEAAKKLGIKRPLLVGVTLLTSMAKEDLELVYGYTKEPSELVLKRALLAKSAGLNGVVTSPQEVSRVKKYCGKNFTTICPGVRPKWSQSDDQERVLTPGEAIREGADYLVIGRPITKAKDPAKALDMILTELNQERSQA